MENKLEKITNYIEKTVCPLLPMIIKKTKITNVATRKMTETDLQNANFSKFVVLSKYQKLEKRISPFYKPICRFE
jgi:hypothetical protein